MNSISRQSPFNDVTGLRREVNRIFEDFFPVRRQEEGEEYDSAMWAPRVDLAESAEEYLISVDLPGVSKEEVSISFEDNRLVLSGERKTAHKEENRNYYRIERAYGRFYRSFSLPKTINADAIKAQFENGVLAIHVPKAEQSKPRQIKVS